MDGSRVILAAHRGDKFNYPENTMPAFESAIRLGCDMIETDVRMTLDGVLVLIHDRSTLRTTGVESFVDELTYDELCELDAGATFEKKFDEKITVPTVREFMERIKDEKILVNWELKVYPKDFSDEIAFGIADRLIEMIYEFGLESRSMMNSFSDRVIEYVYKKYGKQFPIHGQGINKCRKTKDEPELDEKDFFDWCCLYPNEKGHAAIEYKENFDYCVENGIIPCICVKDELESYRTAIEYGCRMFTSNNVEEGHRVLCELGVRK